MNEQGQRSEANGKSKPSNQESEQQQQTEIQSKDEFDYIAAIREEQVGVKVSTNFFKSPQLENLISKAAETAIAAS